MAKAEIKIECAEEDLAKIKGVLEWVKYLVGVKALPMCMVTVKPKGAGLVATDILTDPAADVGQIMAWLGGMVDDWRDDPSNFELTRNPRTG